MYSGRMGIGLSRIDGAAASQPSHSGGERNRSSRKQARAQTPCFGKIAQNMSPMTWEVFTKNIQNDKIY